MCTSNGIFQKVERPLCHETPRANTPKCREENCIRGCSAERRRVSSVPDRPQYLPRHPQFRKDAPLADRWCNAVHLFLTWCFWLFRGTFLNYICHVYILVDLSCPFGSQLTTTFRVAPSFAAYRTFRTDSVLSDVTDSTSKGGLIVV